jgi:hypothetical protein
MSSNFNLLGRNSRVSVSHCNRPSCRLVKRGIASPRERESSECDFDQAEPGTSGHAELGDRLLQACSRRSWRNIRSRSRSSTAFRLVLIECREKFEPMRRQVEAWQKSELTDVTAKVVIYEAFVECKLEAPKHLARPVHDLHFEPTSEEFRPRTICSLSHAFTSAFKELYPVPQFKATAKLGEFLEGRFSQSFQPVGGLGRPPLLFRLASVRRSFEACTGAENFKSL